MEKYKSKFDYLRNILGDIQVIVEVGGHYGEDTLRMHKFFPNAVIYSFEPDPRNISVFKQTCGKFPCIRLIECALSDSNNTDVTFYQTYKDYDQQELPLKYRYIGHDTYTRLQLNCSGASSLKKSDKYSMCTHVETKRFDDWFTTNDIDHVDFMWIDVQGAEKQVLDGCKHVLGKIRYVQLEYGETGYDGGLTKQDTYDMMIRLGFQLVSDYSPKSRRGDYLFKNTLKH